MVRDYCKDGCFIYARKQKHWQNKTNKLLLCTYSHFESKGLETQRKFWKLNPSTFFMAVYKNIMIYWNVTEFMLVHVYKTAQRHITQDSNPHIYRRENLKPRNLYEKAITDMKPYKKTKLSCSVPCLSNLTWPWKCAAHSWKSWRPFSKLHVISVQKNVLAVFFQTSFLGGIQLVD
jgi:hypothetical protein